MGSEDSGSWKWGRGTGQWMVGELEADVDREEVNSRKRGKGNA